MKPATVTFELKLTFEDTRGRDFLPSDLEVEVINALIPFLREFVAGRGIELVKDSLNTKLRAAK